MRVSCFTTTVSARLLEVYKGNKKMIKLIINKLTNTVAWLVSSRVRELELQVDELQDCIADGITEEYGDWDLWRSVAMDTLREMGVLKRLLKERL